MTPTPSAAFKPTGSAFGWRHLRLTGLALLSVPLVHAQDAAATTAPAAAPAPDTTVRLDPFEVQSTSDKSYGEINSNSITAFKTELAKMPVSADVFDQALLDDTGINTVEQAIENFSAGAGVANSQPDVSAANSQYLDRTAGSLSLRGLQAPTIMLNGFFPTGGGIAGSGISSTFNVDKIEVINGPQALLYGVAGTGGVVNVTLRQAQFDTGAKGRVSYQVGEFGDKNGTLDYNMGTDRVAIRVDATGQTLASRRLFYGGPLTGFYTQLAVKPFRNTTLRVSFDRETFDRVNAYGSSSLTLTAASTSNDARNGQFLNYLIATNQLGSAANGGPSGAGALPGVSFNTAASFGGAYSGEDRDHHQYLATIDTVWSTWLSTQVSAGYRSDTDVKIGNSGVAYDAPNATGNPTGTFAVNLGTSAASDLWEPTRQKVARASLLSTNDLFNGSVHSQTVAGIDAARTDSAVISEYYVLADSDWNPVLATSATANHYQILGPQYWAVNNGPVKMALWDPNQPRITFGGQNYVRAITNGTNPAAISPGNQEGLTGSGTGDFRHSTDVQSGFYAANYSNFFGDNLTTLMGFRHGRVYDRAINEASAPNPPSIMNEVQSKFTAYNLGVNAKIYGNLRAYGTFSSSYDPAGSATVDPYGNPMVAAKGTGEEAGLKESLERWNLSGSIAYYHASSKNETLSFTSTIARDINPSGLNGIYNAGSNLLNVDRQTQGMNLVVTASPGNWRLRLSAATVKSTIEDARSFGQLYNDQFYTNSSGAVTFADGTPVYVPPTFNSKATPLVAPQGSQPANYVPLTLALMNTSSSPYYANPAPVSSEISGTTSVSTVLKQVDPVHGAILTGLTGLPISKLQVAPNASSPPPGTIVVTEAGDAVSGFPRYSANFLGVYQFTDGWLRGFRLGGSASVAWKTSMYYYYPQGVAAVNSSRIMLYLPTETVLNGIVGWQHRFARTTFSTQVNVNNLLNHYHVILLPSYVNGWAGPNNATLDQTPRSILWSSSFSF